MKLRVPNLVRSMIEPNAYFGQHEINSVKVGRYVAAINRGDVFPPVVAVRYGEKVMPLDGHHRLAAAAVTGTALPALECDGEEFEDFCREAHDAGLDGDRLVLEAAAKLLEKLK